MRTKLCILMFALTAMACDDEAAREIEILSLGTPADDAGRVELAYARARQVYEHMNPIDRVLFEGTPEQGHLAREQEALDLLIAEVGGVPSTPGSLGAEARAAAFTPNGEFRGSRTRLHAATRSIEFAADAAFAERDRARGTWIPVGGAAIGTPLLGVFALIVLRLGKRKPKPAGRAR